MANPQDFSGLDLNDPIVKEALAKAGVQPEATPQVEPQGYSPLDWARIAAGTVARASGPWIGRLGGGLLGGAAGTAIGPEGTVGGAIGGGILGQGVGTAAGEAIAELIEPNKNAKGLLDKLSPKRIATEGVIGAAFPAALKNVSSIPRAIATGMGVAGAGVAGRKLVNDEDPTKWGWLDYLQVPLGGLAGHLSAKASTGGAHGVAPAEPQAPPEPVPHPGKYAPETMPTILEKLKKGVPLTEAEARLYKERADQVMGAYPEAQRNATAPAVVRNAVEIDNKNSAARYKQADADQLSKFKEWEDAQKLDAEESKRMADSITERAKQSKANAKDADKQQIARFEDEAAKKVAEEAGLVPQTPTARIDARTGKLSVSIPHKAQAELDKEAAALERIKAAQEGKDAVSSISEAESAIDPETGAKLSKKTSFVDPKDDEVPEVPPAPRPPKFGDVYESQEEATAAAKAMIAEGKGTTIRITARGFQLFPKPGAIKKPSTEVTLEQIGQSNPSEPPPPPTEPPAPVVVEPTPPQSKPSGGSGAQTPEPPRDVAQTGFEGQDAGSKLIREEAVLKNPNATPIEKARARRLVPILRKQIETAGSKIKVEPKAPEAPLPTKAPDVPQESVPEAGGGTPPPASGNGPGEAAKPLPEAPKPGLKVSQPQTPPKEVSEVPPEPAPLPVPPKAPKAPSRWEGKSKDERISMLLEGVDKEKLTPEHVNMASKAAEDGLAYAAAKAASRAGKTEAEITALNEAERAAGTDASKSARDLEAALGDLKPKVKPGDPVLKVARDKLPIPDKSGMGGRGWKASAPHLAASSGEEAANGLTFDAVAELTGKSKRTIRRAIDAGHLNAYKKGVKTNDPVRVMPEDVENWRSRGFPNDTSKGEISPMLAARVGLGAAGAIGGSLEDKDHPLQGAVIGATAGALAPSVVKRIPQVVEAAKNGTLKETGRQLYHELPNYQRFSLLSDPRSLPANIAAPFGSVFMGGIEKLLSGDKRGASLIKELFRGRENLKGARSAFQRASEHGQEFGRADIGTGAPLGPAETAMAFPGTMMTTADIMAQDIGRRVGFDPTTMRKMTLTNEPGTVFPKLSKSIMNFGREPGSVLPKLMLPFKRTAMNIVESGIERTPGAGLANWLLKAPHEREGLQENLVKQGLGGAAFLAAKKMGENASGDPQAIAQYRKWISNMSGQYAMLASAGFAAGLAEQQGRNPHESIIDNNVGSQSHIMASIMNELPVPTVRSLQDIGNSGLGILSGKPAHPDAEGINRWLPRSFVPGAVRTLADPQDETAMAIEEALKQLLEEQGNDQP